MKRLRRVPICILTVLLLLSPRIADAKTDEAEDLTDRVSFEFGSYPDGANAVLENGENYGIFEKGSSFAVTWDASLPEARLCLQWHEMPADVSVLQYDEDGALLSEERFGAYPETVTPLVREARKAVVQAGEHGMTVRFCRVYGEGALPDPFHEWQELPEHLDYLLISTHPDDDVLFLGSVVPTYGAERGYIGTIVYVTNQNRIRITEAENGAWAMGLRYRPVFFGMRDIGNKRPIKDRALFPYEELLVNTVRAYRRLKPVVVFAQDADGEYGHWQHKLTSKAAREAFALAADPSYDPESAEICGVWQVQKVYLHLYKKNPITIDAHTSLAFFDGMDALEVARAAYRKHESQQRYRFKVRRDGGAYAFNRFGMAEGVVPAGTDVFDNIDETLLSTYIAPEPTPEPTLAPTEGPTAEPTAAPTRKPTAAPTKEPTPEPTPVPEPMKEPAAKPDLRPLLWVAAATVSAAAFVGVAAYFWKKRRAAKDKPAE